MYREAYIDQLPPPVATHRRRKAALALAMTLLAACSTGTDKTTNATLPDLKPLPTTTTARVADRPTATAANTIAASTRARDTVAVSVAETVPLPVTQAEAPTLPPVTLATAKGKYVPRTTAPATTAAAPTTTTLSTPDSTASDSTTSPTSVAADSCFKHDAQDMNKPFTGDPALPVEVISKINVGDHDGAGECSEWIVIRRLKINPTDQSPGLHAGYVKQPIRNGASDQIVDMKGAAFLQITIGASIDPSVPPILSTRTLENIVDLRITQNDEGSSTITAVLDAKHPFTVVDRNDTAGCTDGCFVIEVGDAIAA